MIHSIRTPLAMAAACGLLFSAAVSAFAAPKDYQYTGTVTAMTDSGFSVMKGKETWEFAKDGETKLPEGAKVGDKVTVHYVMHATAVDASAAKEKAPAKEKAAAKGKKADMAPATTTPAAAMPATTAPAETTAPAATAAPSPMP